MKRRRIQPTHGIWIALCVLMASACASGDKQVIGAGEQAFHGPMPRVVAILPFLDKTGKQEASEIVRRGFANHFSSLPFTDMGLARTDSLLRKAGLNDAEEIHRTPPARLKEILNVDAFILGTIENFDRLFAVVYSQVAVGADVTMIDAEGRTIWRDKRTARIHEGGASLSPVGLIATVVGASMNMRDVQLLRACDDLFREMIKTIPTPKTTLAALPPTIRLVAQDTRDLPRGAGDEIRVVLEGDPGMQAWFDIGDYRKGVDMREVEPGGYLGTYRVEPGDNVENAPVIGYLSDKAGSVGRWTDALGSVTMDTIPPDMPTGPLARGGNLKIDLEWKPSRASDLAGYIVSRSETPLSGYLVIGETEFTTYSDNTVANLTPYYYKIAAVDRTGNRSADAGPLKGVAIPSGPTPVSGALDENTTWYAGAGPYVFQNPVIIGARATLTIEPGTRIDARGHGLIVRGRLEAEGTADRYIVFHSTDRAGAHKEWPGIVFDQTVGEPDVLAFCRIENAKTAVTCRSSSPVITHSELTGNVNGIDLTGGFSAAVISRTLIRGNRGVGVRMGDAARPEITDCRIIENIGGGVLILGAGKATLLRNIIANNSGGGLVLVDSPILLEGNAIHDNTPHDLTGQPTGTPIEIGANWWGRADWRTVIDRIHGRFHFNRILDGPAPEGEPVRVPIARELPNPVVEDILLTRANSPYEVIGEIDVQNDATIYIRPGAVLAYHRQAAIRIMNGGVVARGYEDDPIVMTSAAAIPAPGDYGSAFRFMERTPVSSSLQYCRIQFASIALDVHHGRPEINHCYIADNAQSGVRCVNDAAPVIRYSTLARNRGAGAVECRGMANPRIRYNNFIDNTVAIQAFSSIYIDARDNYWGMSPPDDSVIWAESIEGSIRIVPYSETIRTDAFRPAGTQESSR